MSNDLDALLTDFSSSQSQVTSWRRLGSPVRGETGSIAELRQLKQSLYKYRDIMEEPSTPPRFESEFEHKTPQPKEKRRAGNEGRKAKMQQMTDPRASQGRLPDEILRLARKTSGRVDDTREIPIELAGEVLRNLLGDISLKSVVRFVYEIESNGLKSLAKSLENYEKEVKLLRQVVKETCNLMSEMSIKWAKDRQEVNSLRQQISTSTKSSEADEVSVLKPAPAESEQKAYEFTSLLKKTQPRQVETENSFTQTEPSALEEEVLNLRQQLARNLEALASVEETIEENVRLKDELTERNKELSSLASKYSAIQSILCSKLAHVKG